MSSWVLIIWLASPSNFTVYEKFKSEEDCLNKMSTVQNALQQASSKMQVSCRNQKAGDVFKKNEIAIAKYTLR